MAGRMEEAWWAAMIGQVYEDGSLVIEDDTLDVNGGGTVNLRVKLGAKPRSDVTVALSESSSLISLAPSSLTFTRDNWDTPQPVVVTGAGNRQEIALPSARWRKLGSTHRGWSWQDRNDKPEIIAGLRGSAARFLREVDLIVPPGTRGSFLGFDGQQGSIGDTADLSAQFESSGSFTISSGAHSITFLIGTDLLEPYFVANPVSQADFDSFSSHINTAQPGTLTLRDYISSSATINLSASGTDEYEGVTDSATVTVD